jgi:hypothetical protein
MDSDNQYSEAKRRIIEQLQNSVHAQNEGRYNDIGLDYSLLYDFLTEGRFSETINAQAEAHMKGGAENKARASAARNNLYDYQKSLGIKYDKIFDALQFLNNWMDASNHWEEVEKHWVKEAKRNIKLLQEKTSR